MEEHQKKYTTWKKKLKKAKKGKKPTREPASPEAQVIFGALECFHNQTQFNSRIPLILFSGQHIQFYSMQIIAPEMMIKVAKYELYGEKCKIDGWAFAGKRFEPVYKYGGKPLELFGSSATPMDVKRRKGNFRTVVEILMRILAGGVTKHHRCVVSEPDKPKEPAGGDAGASQTVEAD